MNWLQQHTPDYAASFLSGLSHSEIQETLGEYYSQLPEEFYELYQWRNGSTGEHPSLFYPTMAFLPLDYAIQEGSWIAEDTSFEEERIEFDGHRVFPLMCFDGDYYAVVLSEQPRKTAPVIWIPDEDNRAIPYCSSITSMMVTFAECYETGAYYLSDDGYLENNSKKSSAILRKNNPAIGERAMSITTDWLALRSELPPDLLQRFMDEMKVVEIYRCLDAIEPLIEALVFWKTARSRGGISIRSTIVQTLSALPDSRAFELLEEILVQDPDGGIRRNAAKALGELGDPRSIPLLISALEDVDSSAAASAALFQIGNVDAVIQALPELNAYGRESAVWLLSRFGDARALEPITELLKDRSHNVQFAARKAIAVLSP